MTQLQIILYRELYKRSLYEFVKGFWNEVDPAKFIDGKLIKFYCEVFEYFCRKWTGQKEKSNINLPKLKNNEIIIDVRQNKQNLCLNVPPRHMKSIIFNVFGPTWLWLSNPIKAVSISHTADLAREMNRKRYNLINSDKFKLIFPNIILKSNSSSYLEDSRGGELRSLNRNAFTGYGGDVIINDDLTNAEQAVKDMGEMDNAWSYYKNTMPSRINDINKCIILNIQQRLAPNDITGHIMADAKLASQYCFVVIPAYFEKTTYLICPISGDIIEYKKGSYLWPERFGNYESLKANVGNNIFETQYLQHPVASDIAIFKEDMFNIKNPTEIPDIDYADFIYASHDFPVKDKDSSDFLGSVLAYKVGSNIYIKDCLEKKMSYIKSVNYVKQLEFYYPGIIQIIEDKANGSPILNQLQDEVAGMQAFQPGTNSKYQRLENASLYYKNVIFIADKQIKIDNNIKWDLSDSLKNLKNRLLNFPYVEHDDIVDAFSQLLLFVFMDKRYSVYGRSFNDDNIFDKSKLNLDNCYGNVFFNKEGDLWKVVKIIINYGEQTKLYVINESKFKADIHNGFKQLKELYPSDNVFIDCSSTDSLYGMNEDGITVERYHIDDFDKSVGELNLAFSKKLILIDKRCFNVKNDIENFKFSKSKDENVKYITEKDGFIACLRIAMKYYGGIV